MKEFYGKPLIVLIVYSLLYVVLTGGFHDLQKREMMWSTENWIE
jgi:hypothetical protein